MRDVCGAARVPVVSRRGALALVGSAAFSLMGAGCVDQHPTDAQGRVQRRLVATSPAVAEVCDRLGLDLVGVPQTARGLPARYEGLPQVGTAMAPDLERLSALRPTCVLSPASLAEDLRPKYAAAGLACVFLDLGSVGGLYDSADYLGSKFSRERAAQELRREYETEMERIRQRTAHVEPPRVLVLMGVPGSYVVATPGSYVGSLVALSGGENVYADPSSDFVNVNTEDMLERDPDVILRCAHALPDQVMQMFAKEFAENDIWEHFRAVQTGCVYDLPSDLFGMSAEFSYPAALDELAGLLYEGGAHG